MPLTHSHSKAPVSRPALEVRLRVRQRRYRLHSAPTPAGLPNTSLCFASAAWISLSTTADYRPVSCSLVARFLICKQRPSCAIEGTLPNGISWLTPTVNHCSAHETWSHAVVRCSTTHHCHYGLLPLPVAPSQDAEMARPTQVPFRFAPTTRTGPLLLKNSHSRSAQKFHRARVPFKRRSRFWWIFSIPRPGQFFQKREFSTAT